ncbi:hypothetical protein JMJ56_19500 [Belnapia sp. T18]|uniref:Integrase catalytic domain-containing protein n=1 Tax=Belnapia arida TaxID=2804533 RepID=A0ABS1U683_9PROT|nr:hypothetical protein [Belnapia arida]
MEILIERCRHHYNTALPHNALGYRPPAPEAVLPCRAGPTYAALRHAQPARLKLSHNLWRFVRGQAKDTGKGLKVCGVFVVRGSDTDQSALRVPRNGLSFLAQTALLPRRGSPCPHWSVPHSASWPPCFPS